MNADKNRIMDSSGNLSARLRRRAVPAIMLACCMAFTAGCAGTGGSTMPPGSAGDTADSAGDGKISVVTTIFPPYDFVREIAGDEADIKMLLKPGEETHSYEPTPQDIIAIQNSDVFIYTGGENDVWEHAI